MFSVNAYEIKKEIENKKARSAWENGVKGYALELLDNFTDCGTVNPCYFNFERFADIETELLNGARDWWEYSRGGCSEFYDCDIAERLCNPSELKRTDGGAKRPNPRESWIDVQGRALYQAAALVKRTAAALIAE